MIYQHDISHLKAEAKRLQKATGKKRCVVLNELAKARGYSSWETLQKHVLGAEQSETLVAWFERKHVAVSERKEGDLKPLASPHDTLVAAGYGASPAFREAVNTLEQRGPWHLDKLAGSFTIKLADKAELRAVLNWAKEDDKAGHDSFWVNRNIIRQCQSEGDLYVLVEDDESVPAAFLCEGMGRPDIIQVKNDQQHKGYGTALALFSIERWRAEGNICVDIEVAPVEAMPFWEGLGFVPYRGRLTPYRAYLPLVKRFRLPEGAPNVPVTISLYNERVKWQKDPEVEPFHVVTPVAKRMSDGSIAFEERFAIFPEVDRQGGWDVVISIEVDGRRIYRDKAKYQDARALGVTRADDGFYIDGLTLP